MTRDIDREYRVWVRMFGADQAAELRLAAEAREAEIDARQPEIVIAPRSFEWREHAQEWEGIATALGAYGVKAIVEPDERQWVQGSADTTIALLTLGVESLNLLVTVFQAAGWTIRKEGPTAEATRRTAIYGANGEVLVWVEMSDDDNPDTDS